MRGRTSVSISDFWLLPTPGRSGLFYFASLSQSLPPSQLTRSDENDSKKRRQKKRPIILTLAFNLFLIQCLKVGMTQAPLGAVQWSSIILTWNPINQIFLHLRQCFTDWSNFWYKLSLELRIRNGRHFFMIYLVSFMIF